MNWLRHSRWVVLPLVVALLLARQARVQAKHDAAPVGAKGAIILYTVPPRSVCVGDTFTVHGGGFISPPDISPANPGELAPVSLSMLRVAVSTALGSATPGVFVQPGSEIYFSFTYTARSAGDETINVVENDGLAADTLQFKVKPTCAYGTFLSSLPGFTVHTPTNGPGA
jgi:hypothetical protein